MSILYNKHAFFISLLRNLINYKPMCTKIEQKGMTFDHVFGYSFPLFSSLLKKREEEKDNE